MGRYVAGDAPAMDRLVADTVKSIGAEIESLHVPKLGGVVLGGGYGRGEGGVFIAADGRQSLYNDLDFFAIAVDGVSDADLATIADQLEPVSRRWTETLGIDVDFTVRTPWRIRHDQERLMIQELVHGYFDVAGKSGKELFADVETREPSQFPWTEAVRLLVNRGVGLMLAQESQDRVFAARNVNKCILGVGDARLIAKGGYRWKATERADALRDRLYTSAMEWKFRPRPDGVCGWGEARGIWLRAVAEIMAAGQSSGALRRSAYQAVRWIVRRKTLGELQTVGYGPVVRILRRLERVVDKRQPIPASLRRDWEIFN